MIKIGIDKDFFLWTNRKLEPANDLFISHNNCEGLMNYVYMEVRPKPIKCKTCSIIFDIEHFNKVMFILGEK